MKTIKPRVWKMPHRMEVISPSKNKVCISTQEGHYIIEKQDIYWLEASGNYTIIHLKEKEICCAQTLSIIIKKINLSSFIRIHKSHAINLHMISFINPSLSNITLNNDADVPIARSKKDEVRKIIQIHFS